MGGFSPQLLGGSKMSYAYRRRKKLIKRANKLGYKRIWGRGGKLISVLFEKKIPFNK